MHHAVQLGTSQISFKFILQHHNDQTFPYIVNLFLKKSFSKKRNHAKYAQSTQRPMR